MITELRTVAPPRSAGSSALAHRRLESQEAAEHRLLAVEIDGVGTGQQVGDLFPCLHPAIKACCRKQFCLQATLGRHDSRSLPTHGRVTGKSLHPSIEQIVERAPVGIRLLAAA